MTDLTKLTTIHLFGGIGGCHVCDAVLGKKTYALAEIIPFRQNLAKMRGVPNVWGDVTKLDFTSLNIDSKGLVISSGTPCQSFSRTGK